MPDSRTCVETRHALTIRAIILTSTFLLSPPLVAQQRDDALVMRNGDRLPARSRDSVPERWGVRHLIMNRKETSHNADPQFAAQNQATYVPTNGKTCATRWVLCHNPETVADPIDIENSGDATMTFASSFSSIGSLWSSKDRSE